MTGALPPYLPSLTGIRGVAAWWIVLYHFRDYISPYWPRPFDHFMNYGYIAVDLFFVLSGFIIYYVYHAKFAKVTPKLIRSFLSARISRIFPLHIFFIVLFLVNPLAIYLFASAPIDPARYGWQEYFLQLFLIHNWGSWGTDTLAWNVPSWSISVEMFAYVSFPAIAVTVRLWARHWIFGLLLAVAAAIALAWIFTAAGLSLLKDEIPRFGLVRCLLEFVMGVGLCQIYLALSGRGARIMSWALGAAMVLGIWLLARGVLPDFTVVPAIFFCMIFIVAREGAIVRAVLANRVVHYIGLVSYSTYMCHFLVRDWVKFTLIEEIGQTSEIAVLFYLGGVAAASVLLYHFVEVPARNFARNILAAPGRARKTGFAS
jgi:peptidoglycan/LPS O-acetylase OafA/YrhL